MKILTETQKKALSLLASSSLKDKFYWTGGTLLAYHYLNHRKSLDLDFFSENRFSFEEINHFAQDLKKKIGFKKIEFQKIFDRFEFLFQNKEILRIEFVYYNQEKKTLQKREKLLGVYVDSLENIAANKVLAYFDRNEPKDLFDIYFLIIKAEFTPQKLLQLAYQKFDIKFGESLFWSESFRGISSLRKLKPLMLEDNEKKKEKILSEIEGFFCKGSKRYLEQVLED